MRSRVTITTIAVVVAAALIGVLFAILVPRGGVGQASPPASLPASAVGRASIPSSFQPTHTPAPSASPTPSPTAAPAGWELAVGIDSLVADMAETDRLIIAVGQDGDDPSILTSADGVDWAPVELEPLGLGTGIIHTVTAAEPGLVATGGRFIPDPDGSGYGTYEPFILFSSDGTTWEEVAVPGPCTVPVDVVSGEFGFVSRGERCRGEGDFDPRPLSILHSTDGRTWTVTTDIPAFSGDDAPWMIASDGSRIAAMSDGSSIWTSDDAGGTWTHHAGPFADGPGGAREITHGHGQFLVLGDHVDEAGVVVTPVTCVSADAVAWECRDQTWTADLGGQLGYYEPGVTATGFLLLLTQLPDEFTAGPSETVVLTSADGLSWQGGVERDLHNLFVSSLQFTTHGIFMLGSTNPYRPEDLSELRIAVHRRPLP